MIKSTTNKKVKKASSKKANPGKDWIRHADLRPKGGSPDRSPSKDDDKIISNQEYYAKLHKLAEDIQWKKRDEYPIHGYPWHRALEDASEILAKKKQNPSKKCRVIKVRRKISMGKGKRPRILQVRRKVCNPGTKYTKSKVLEVFEHDFYPKIKKEYGNRLYGDMFKKELNESFNSLLDNLVSEGLITEKQSLSWQNPYKYSS